MKKFEERLRKQKNVFNILVTLFIASMVLINLSVYLKIGDVIGLVLEVVLLGLGCLLYIPIVIYFKKYKKVSSVFDDILNDKNKKESE